MSKSFDKMVERLEVIAADELQEANTKFPAFSGKHEGFAVLREEIDEMVEECNKTVAATNELWESVKRNEPLELEIYDIKQSSLRTAAEALQVAAMAMKFITSKVCKDIEELPEVEYLYADGSSEPLASSTTENL